MGFLKVGAFALVSFGIAIYSIVRMDEVTTKQPAAVSLAPVPVRLTIEGTIVLDDAPAGETQPYVLYAELKPDGTSAVKTKRLVLPARYTCALGDLPCALPIDTAHPFIAGDQVRIVGTADADLLHVEQVEIIRQ